jgi:hypothetical protein
MNAVFRVNRYAPDYPGLADKDLTPGHPIEFCYAQFYNGNINGDCDIDMSDLALLAEQWLQTNCGQCNGADLTGDWKVDFADFAALAANWLEGFDESCYALTYSGDIDGDCNIDLHDFAMLAQQWLQTNCGQCSGADLTGDWKVGFADFVVFAANWLEGF